VPTVLMAHYYAGLRYILRIERYPLLILDVRRGVTTSPVQFYSLSRLIEMAKLYAKSSSFLPVPFLQNSTGKPNGYDAAVLLAAQRQPVGE